jgi:hypothetical protein
MYYTAMLSSFTVLSGKKTTIAQVKDLTYHLIPQLNAGLISTPDPSSNTPNNLKS